MTPEQLEAKIRPCKLALVESFGLGRYDYSSDFSVYQDGFTVKYFGGPAGPPLGAVLRCGDRDSVTVEFPADAWTPEQKQAVHDYIGQFPSAEYFNPVQP